MNMIEAIKSVFSKYATFKGRARRSEYWYFVLFTVICSVLISCLSLVAPSAGTVLNGLFTLAILIPAYAVETRRLHDVGRSGWLIVAKLVLGIASLVCLFAGIGLGNMMNAMNGQPVDGSSVNVGLSISGLTLMALYFLLGLYIFVLTLFDSKLGDNQYGPSPKDDSALAEQL